MNRKKYSYQGIDIVFDNQHGKIDKKRALLIQFIILYANLSGREVAVIFFNGEDTERGASFFFKRDDESHDLA